MMDNFLSALNAIWSNKVRSSLTLLGVVIGVSSVTILVSLGQGLKNDVAGLIRGFGTNVVIIVPGQVDPESGPAAQNPFNLINFEVLTTKDANTIADMPAIASSSPMSPVSGTVAYGKRQATPAILGGNSQIATAFEILKIDEGRMFRNDEGKVAVMGTVPRDALFGKKSSVGRKIMIAGEEFTVVGQFGKSKSAGVIGSELDSLALIPFKTATVMNKDTVKIIRIVAKVRTGENVDRAKEKIKAVLLANHKGQRDFTVLTQDQILGLFDRFLTLATSMVSAIAAISLIVGGIGIMNIMFVSVTERTREIGIRKAVGATKGAILVQFLIEAVIVTLVGGVIGLAVAFGVGFAVAANTDLTPAISLDIIVLAVGISSAVGLVFGIWPALNAARKDPIDALRYE